LLQPQALARGDTQGARAASASGTGVPPVCFRKPEPHGGTPVPLALQETEMHPTTGLNAIAGAFEYA